MNHNNAKRLGPYRKWSVSDVAKTTPHQSEDITATHSKKAKLSPRQTENNEIRNVEDLHVDNSDSGENEFVEFDSWTCVEPEITDPDLDILFEDLKNEISEVEDAEFVDDSPLNVFCEYMVETINHNVETEFVTSKTVPEKDGRHPLYTGSKRLLGVTMLLLCCFMIRFQLSDEAMSALLNLLAFLLPEDSKLTDSLYGLKQYLQNFVSLPKVQHYCTNCFTHVYDTTSKVCTNLHCARDLTKNGSKAYFIQHSLISQIRIMFMRESFTVPIRTHRYKHYRNNKNGDLKDVYDGLNYKELFDKGLLSDPNSLSFSMSTDGVPIFKSSGVSMWPVYLLVNELPLSERKLKENVLFYGIWISSTKPMMWSFLKPLYEELKIMEDGVKFTDHNQEVFTSKAYLTSCICDLPAKCLLTNSMQFNGHSGCWHCLQEGESFITEKGGRTHVFPFNQNNPDGPPRTSENLKHDVAEAVRNCRETNSKKVKPVRGIKGPNWFMFLSNFNIIHGFVIDYMHGVCLGVMKNLLNLWFSKDYKKEIFSHTKFCSLVDKNLRGIKPTFDITRLPRGLCDLVHWKASEYRNFLLYWGVPLLNGVLKNEHYVHFCLLVQAIHILLSENITSNDIDTASSCLTEFVKNFHVLYSLRFMTMNTHQLLHLCENVRANGPLYVNNLFVFEDMNGFIKKHIHGTQAVDKQVIKTMSIIQAIPVLKEKFLIPDSDENIFYSSLVNNKYQNWTQINDLFSVIGKIIDRDLSSPELDAVAARYEVDDKNVKSFQKVYLKSKHCLLYSSSYTRMFRRDQSIIKYMYDENEGVMFGSISSFIGFHEKNCAIAGAIIQPFDCNYKPQNNIHKITLKTNKLKFVRFENIISLCMLVFVEGPKKYFVCEFPNRCDSD